MDLSDAAVGRAIERLVELGGDADTAADDPYLAPQRAGDMVLDRTNRYRLAELATAADMPVERVVELLGLLGIRAEPADQVRFSDDDAALLREIDRAPAQWVSSDEVADLLRVIGRTMATAAEASIAYHTTSVEPRVTELRDWVDANYEMAEMATAVGEHLGAVFRHHLLQAVHFQRLSNVGAERGQIVEIAVAFVDLTGFTKMAHELDLLELGEMVGRLDVVATDTARAHHCRVVKLIGDEAMFVGQDAEPLVATAWEFVDAVADQGIEAHGALALGRVIMNHGDYFGTAVNLAARLVDHAGPGELLCDEAVASIVGAEPAGTRTLRGMPAAVPVYRLSR